MHLVYHRMKFERSMLSIGYCKYLVHCLLFETVISIDLVIDFVRQSMSLVIPSVVPLSNIYLAMNYKHFPRNNYPSMGIFLTQLLRISYQITLRPLILPNLFHILILHMFRNLKHYLIMKIQPWQRPIFKTNKKQHETNSCLNKR